MGHVTTTNDERSQVREVQPLRAAMIKHYQFRFGIWKFLINSCILLTLPDVTQVLHMGIITYRVFINALHIVIIDMSQLCLIWSN
jgi:hypothetical protein